MAEAASEVVDAAAEEEAHEAGAGTAANNRQSFQEVKKENEHFERFYNELNIVPDGEEREQFWAALRRELPNSFRFCGSKGYAHIACSQS